jgi:predicted nucleic acid-binding protein
VPARAGIGGYRKAGFLLAHYQSEFRSLVAGFGEPEAFALAGLIAALKRKGQMMKFFDAAIGATAIAHGDKLLALDNDFDRLRDKITLIKG